MLSAIYCSVDDSSDTISNSEYRLLCTFLVRKCFDKIDASDPSDTAGQERFIRDSSVAVMVYDVACMFTLDLVQHVGMERLCLLGTKQMLCTKVEQPTEFPLWSMSISSLARQMHHSRSNNLEDVPADTLSLRLWRANDIGEPILNH
ncbi:hypothetical protein V6N11_006600 [Hibiscus sabdariffa]|uniref:Uncharacterized protein n=1 Tax=Hibiscus sabdariffa TaxID=183260 RepID=A0ABR2RRC5_9ROSI